MLAPLKLRHRGGRHKSSSDPLGLFLGFPEQRGPAGDTTLVATDKGKGDWNLPVEGRRAWGPGRAQLWEVFPHLLRQAWGRVGAGPREERAFLLAASRSALTANPGCSLSHRVRPGSPSLFPSGQLGSGTSRQGTSGETLGVPISPRPAIPPQ